ncbi:hypothetical protein BFJ63_vAg13751 [Fusarium oxysporum f. sp. narcissi]|uniref:Major facilitator superfamily (MFS) profile domain-containing protein n=1 Tax=Fusarium oxysporum f. sp. narcissi TaxID=451672 RepID=A0A4Q2VEU0_FUSOX|nr:hypothetical protein FOMA001_g3891 [Fusarium oxysporum f. sp. matthiolae]RYC83348.1 hypothetical protein BFJ63_vAg13751 [Fusarium oxysporum f. sp. narcissi]
MGSADNTTTTSVMELAPIPQDQVSHENDSSMAGDSDPSEPTTQSQSLKPADGGLAAWTVLVTGFIFEAMFWGFPMAFGVFQNYYSQQPEFKNDKSRLAAVGTLAQSLFYLGAPLSALATKRYPKFRRQQIWLGWPLCILGLLTASFATSVSGLIATQGFLYGFGFVTFTYPIVAMLNDWWVARKGMAFGLISASSGATGAAMPFIIEALLKKHGYQTTLRACAIAMIILTGPLLPLLKDRLPPSENAGVIRTDWSFLKKPLFWVYSCSVVIQGVGFFFPTIFLPSYAHTIGLSSFDGALLLAIMAIAQLVGQGVFGYLSDRHFPVSLLSSIACFSAGIAALTLWGFGKSKALLILFAVVHGFCGFGFGTLRVAMGRAVSNDSSTVLATYAIFVFLQGVGNILVGPISTALMTSTVVRGDYAARQYAGVVLLTGLSSIIAGLTIVLWHCIELFRPTSKAALLGGRSS